MKSILQKPAAREAIKAAVFVLLLALAFLAFCRFFSFKYDEGVYSTKIFYEQEEDTVDVLILGSSHAYEHFHTGVLYDEFGLASFNLASGAQQIWTSYHYLIEALKTQTPSLVILEGYTLAPIRTHREEAWDVRSTYGFKPSLNWIENLKAAIPEEEFWEFFFRFYRYHSRYDGDLTVQDYAPYKGKDFYRDWKGYIPNMRHLAYDVPASIGITDVEPLLPDVEVYYRKLIELCQSRDIPLMVVVSPTVIEVEEMPRFNGAAQIAQEYGVPFINFNTTEYLELLEFDFARDMGVSNHLNYRSAIRFTRAVGDIITASFDLPDRRGDSRYASWARSSAYHARDMANQQMREITNLAPYLERIAQDPDYTAVISVTGYCADYFDQITAWLAPFGVDDIYFDYAMNGTWAVRNCEVIRRWKEGMRHPYVQLGEHTVTFSETHCPILDLKPVKRVDRGLNIIVYDHVTQSIADTVGFSSVDGFTAVR